MSCKETTLDNYKIKATLVSNFPLILWATWKAALSMLCARSNSLRKKTAGSSRADDKKVLRIPKRKVALTQTESHE